ncbi:MAG: peptidase M3 [Deltaproteobacteria bacterium]|nr:peptidase M3 [Deltaproteobacteria bacterium]
MNANNPLLLPWTGPMAGAPPLDEVTTPLLEAALEAAMLAEDEELARLRNVDGPSTFENTVKVLDGLGDDLDRVVSIYSNFCLSFSTPELRALRRVMQPRLSARRDDLYGDNTLFERIRVISRDDGLNPEQQRLCQRLLERFEDAGAHLDEATRAKVAQVNQRLSSLYSEFSDRVLADEEELVTWLDEDALTGMAESWISAARETATIHGRPEAWAVANTRSAVEPYLTFSPHRAQRQAVWHTFYHRGELREETHTQTIITEILALRLKRARLLGFETHAHKMLDRTMAGSPEAAIDLMKQIWVPARKTFERELAKMKPLAEADGIAGPLEPWDVRFYGEQVRRRDHDLDPAVVQKYFSLERLRDAMFWAATQTMGWTFEQVDVPVPHTDVTVWAIRDADENDIGIFHFDPFARPGKRSGAWMSTYRSQYWGNDRVPPIVLNTCNFLKPGEGTAALLTYTNAITLFHEFGHAMHGLASRVRYNALAGTSVVRDFVEFPSQLNERWLSTPELLTRFGRHIDTDEPLSAELLEKIEAAANAASGFRTMEFLASAVVDMQFHLQTEPVDPGHLEAETLAEWGLPSAIVMRHRTPHFSHIFSGDGYSAGYYCYLWADTLVADAAEAFEEQGYYNRAFFQRYHDLILSRGHTVDAAEAFRSFRGRDPEVGPLLRHRGLV